jgi:PAS domain S-box-containing protein
MKRETTARQLAWEPGRETSQREPEVRPPCVPHGLKWFERTLAAVADAVIAVDVQGEVLFLNRAAERLTGWRSDEAARRPVGEVFRVVDGRTGQAGVDPGLRAIAEGAAIALAPNIILTKDGGARAIEDSALPVCDDSGRLLGAVLVFRAAPERHTDAVRRASRPALAALGQGSIAASAPDGAALADLLDASWIAPAVNANAGARQEPDTEEFLAMLGHELRNPLAPIRNALELMRLRPNAEAQAKAHEMIERQVKNLTRLVDDLLDVSRITRGSINVRREEVELSGLVANAVESVQPFIQARLHRVQISLPGEPMPVFGDETRLAQVVANLLNNAAKYTPEGGHIQLQLERSGSDAVLRVRDNGIGIAADLLPKVFDLFSQAERSLARSEGGMGIGLTLVRRLVELHGGQVEAFSAGTGCGSEFVVRLPLIERCVPRPAATACAAAQDGIAPLRVLVVDDNIDAASSLEMLLALNGHEVRSAHDGPKAVSIAEEWNPDVLLLDIGLPGMNGYEVASRLRARGFHGRLIALTGYGQEGDRRKSEQAGFDAHLVKPANPEELNRLLVEGAAKAPQ